jgi:hypothetical protein
MRFSILVNASPNGFFSNSKGIRQGNKTREPPVSVVVCFCDGGFEQDDCCGGSWGVVRRLQGQ